MIEWIPLQGEYQVSSLYHKSKLKLSQRRRTCQKQGYNLQSPRSGSSFKFNQYSCINFVVSVICNCDSRFKALASWNQPLWCIWLQKQDTPANWNVWLQKQDTPASQNVWLHEAGSSGFKARITVIYDWYSISLNYCPARQFTGPFFLSQPPTHPLLAWLCHHLPGNKTLNMCFKVAY